MNGSRREIIYWVAHEQRGAHDILGRDAMAQINDARLRIDFRDHTFHDANERIFIAEVRG